jgi:hypothetical protein
MGRDIMSRRKIFHCLTTFELRHLPRVFRAPIYLAVPLRIFSRGGNGGSRMVGGSLGFGSFGFGSPIGGGPPGGGSFLLSKHRLSLGDLSPEMIDAIATLEHFNASGSDSVGVS